jgi:hypothetical protein
VTEPGSGNGRAARAEPAFALGTPEERHLRDNTHYIAPDAPTTAFGLSALLLGIIVNLIILGVPLLIGSSLLGWALRSLGLLGGLGAGEAPFSRQPGWVVAMTVTPITIGLLTAWWAYLFTPAIDREVLVGRRRRFWLFERRRHTMGPRNWLGSLLGRLRLIGPAGVVASCAWALVRLSLLLFGVFIFAPWAVAELSQRANGSGALATVLQGIGFGHRQGQNAPAITLASYVGAVAVLARTAVGKTRTYSKDLASSTNGANSAAQPSFLGKVGGFIRDRLAPYLGVILIAGAGVFLSLKFIAIGARIAPSGSTRHWLGTDLLLVVAAVTAWCFVRGLIDINHTSLHRYYRDRLAAAYIGSLDLDGQTIARLSDLDVPGLPELVLCASAASTSAGDLPPGRNSVSFTFTPTTVGLSRSADAANEIDGDRGKTTDFEKTSVEFSLYDAVAVAGAAVAPLMGHMTTPSKRILFAIANIRLGMWLPAPGYLEKVTPRKAIGRWWQRLVRQHNVRRLWAEMAGTMQLSGKWLYVTDGGHYENLGLVEALRRNPDIILVFDAAGDQQGHFFTLGEAVALARTECGVDIAIDPEGIGPDAGNTVEREVRTTVASGTYTYRANGKTGTLIYGRLGVTRDFPWDVRAYLQGNSGFPTTSTLSQLYDGSEFEAYRAMGEYTAGEMVCALKAVVQAESKDR